MRALAPYLAWGFAVTTLSPLAQARADAPGPDSSVTCEAAFEAADMQLRPGETHLLDARGALRACALPTCKPWMVDDCSRRLAEVEGRIPSVALSAEDARGAPLYDVRVLEGEREIVGKLNGVAVEMDPGPHELVAERDGTRVGRAIVLIEGKKAQQVVFTFSSIAAASSEPSPNNVVAPKLDDRREAPSLAYPWARPFAGGLLASAVVATATGAVLGAMAIADKHDAHCDATNVCDAEPLGDARSAARSATVAFGLGAALALGSVITFVAFGRTRVPARAALHHLQVAW